MAGPYSCAIVGVEIFVERYQVLPVWIALELLGPTVHRPPAVLHPVLLTIEGHRPSDRTGAGALASNCKCQFFGLGHTANREVAVELKRVGTGLFNFAEWKVISGFSLTAKNLSPSAFHLSFRFRYSRWLRQS